MGKWIFGVYSEHVVYNTVHISIEKKCFFIMQIVGIVWGSNSPYEEVDSGSAQRVNQLSDGGNILSTGVHLSALVE